jgi:low temperature requirement protein LtrA
MLRGRGDATLFRDNEELTLAQIMEIMGTLLSLSSRVMNRLLKKKGTLLIFFSVLGLLSLYRGYFSRNRSQLSLTIFDTRSRSK